MNLYAPANLGLITGGRWLERPAVSTLASGVSTDTRSEIAGRVFVALSGEQHDGHDHVAAAAANGAIIAIVDREIPVPPGMGVLLVDDSRRALPRLARRYRQTLEGTRVIAITGSCGKTTTKRLVDAVLGGTLQGTAAPRSFNNDIGVPLTVLAARPSDRYLVVEIGTGAPGEVANLARMTEPDIAVITGIGPSHLEGFGTIEAIAREKASLLSHLPPQGLAVVNAEAQLLEKAAVGVRTVVRYGDDETADLRLTGRGPADAGRWWFEVNGHTRFELMLPGRHNAINAMAALAVGRRFGLDDEVVRAALASVPAEAMRMVASRVGELELFNDAYNANPDSMIAGLETFVEVAATAARRVVVLGDMLELGPDGPMLHQAVGERIVELHPTIDEVVLIGPLAKEIKTGLGAAWSKGRVQLHRALTPKAIERIRGALHPGDAVYLKASRGIALERLAEALAARGHARMLYNLLQSSDQWLDDIGLFRLVQVLYQLEFRAFFAVVLSFAIVLMFGRRTIRWLVKQRIGDSPEFYNRDLNELMESKRATPTMGGLLICSSILVTTLLFADLRQPYIWLAIVVLVWLAVVGGIDDWLKLTSTRRNPGMREGLYAWEKLLFQLGIGFIAGFFLFKYGGEQPTGHALTLPFQRTYAPGTLQLESGVIVLGLVPFVIITVLLVAGTSNAVNLTDGMDGLAAGCMLVCAFAMMVLCYVAGREDAARTLMFPHIAGARELMVVIGAMAGACLGFLWFNCAPAQVFMGDTGSLPLGGLLAYTAVAIRQEFLLVIIGGVFFLEMLSVILQVGYFKSTGGKRIFRCSPLHHHFHLGGWSEQQVVTRFWVFGVAFAMVALVSIKLR